MKKKITYSLVMLALMISPLLFNSGVKAQTAGTMTFTVTTTYTNGSWSGRHDFVVWIENSSGTFVKSRIYYGSDDDHLLEWTTKNPSMNVVDAATGATKNGNPYTYSGIVWIGNDLTGVSPNYTLLPDGTYTVAMELAWGSSKVLGTGRQIYRVNFTKGPSPQTVTPPNQTNFTNMTLQWNPLGVGVAVNEEKANFSVAPNPISNLSKVQYSLNGLAEVNIGLYDVTGKLVKVIVNETQNAGNYSIALSQNGKVSPGIYFIKMNNGKTEHTERILISE